MKNQSLPNTSTSKVEKEIIWFPEWKHFKIVKFNNIYLLFDTRQLVFCSISLEAVKAELIERFHYYEIESTTNQIY